MSNFTPRVKFTTNFDGDEVSMSLARLKRKHIVLIAPYMGEPNEAGLSQIKFKDELEFTNVMAKILPEVVFDFKGLTYEEDDEVKPLGIETVSEETYFANLSARITSKLFEISKPSEEQAKDVKKPSSVRLEESEVDNSTPESAADIP